MSITDRPVTDAMVKLAQNAALLRGQGAVGPEVQEADVPAAGREGRRSPDRDRRLPRHRRSATTCRTRTRFTRSTERRTSCSSAAVTRSTRGGAKRRWHEFGASPERNRPRREIRRGGGGSADGDARGHRPRIRQAERSAERWRRAVPQGVFLDAGRGTRRPDGVVEHLGSEAEGLGLVKNQDEVAKAMYDGAARCRADAAAAHPERQHHQRGSRSAIARSSPTTSWTRPAPSNRSTRDGKRYVR